MGFFCLLFRQAALFSELARGEAVDAEKYSGHGTIRAKTGFNGNIHNREICRCKERFRITNTEQRQNLLVAGIQSGFELDTQNIF